MLGYLKDGVKTPFPRDRKVKLTDTAGNSNWLWHDDAVSQIGRYPDLGWFTRPRAPEGQVVTQWDDPSNAVARPGSPQVWEMVPAVTEDAPLPELTPYEFSLFLIESDLDEVYEAAIAATEAAVTGAETTEDRKAAKRRLALLRQPIGYTWQIAVDAAQDFGAPIDLDDPDQVAFLKQKWREAKQ